MIQKRPRHSKKKQMSRIRIPYNISVSGAAETGHCSPDAVEKAKSVGRIIAKRGYALLTGATTGIPYWAAQGADEAGGLVLGFSPAESRVAHRKTYRLPFEHHDAIFFTGADYSGRNFELIRASDAMVVICGRTGTLSEFSIGLESGKPIGVLEGSGGTADMIREILERTHKGFRGVVFSRDPEDLLDKLVSAIAQQEERPVSWA